MTKLRTASAARADIRGIHAYGKLTFGAFAAKEYLKGLSAMFALLEARPLAGIAESALGVGMRSFAYRLHRIYYRLEGEDLLVVRILHQAQDVPAAFGSSQ